MTTTATRRAAKVQTHQHLQLRASQNSPWLAAAVGTGSALIALPVYLRTLAPSLPTGDSGELIVAARMLGVAHPPGYPLFTLLGHAFTLLPLGSVAYRVNLMSAVFGAATVGVVAIAIFRLVASNRSQTWVQVVSAAVGALALAFSTALWRYSVVAEVFTLNSFLAALLVCLMLEFERRPERIRLLWAAGLVTGLALANQQTVVLIAPACLLLLASGARKLLKANKVRSFVSNAGIGAGLLVSGALLYVYLPLAAARDPALNWGDPRTPEAVWRHVTRADYGTFNLVVSGQHGSPIDHVALLLRNLSDGFTVAGVALALFGAWWLWRRLSLPGLALALAFVITGPVFIAYANPSIDNPVLYGVLERFYILPSIFAAILVGLGVAQVATGPRRPWHIAAAALVLIPVAALVLHAPQVDQSTNSVDHNYGLDVLAPLEPDALFLLTGDAATMAVDYVQLVDGFRSDVVSLNMEKLKLATYVSQIRRQHSDIAVPFDAYVPGDDAMARLVEANLFARPVYVLGEPSDTAFMDHFDTQRAGFALKLLPRGSGANLYALVETHLDLFRHAHFPDRAFPDTTFEAGIAKGYGALAFDIAYVLDDGAHDEEAIRFYRLALQLDPTYAPAEKNLGLLLFKTIGPTQEVTSLWQDYLVRMPDDPQAPAIREQLNHMR